MSGTCRNRLPLIGLAAMSLAACATTEPQMDDPAVEAQVDPATLPADEATRAAADRAPPLERANFWGNEHAKAPSAPYTTLKFGRALRAIGSHERAAEIATQTLIVHPHETELHLLKGRAHMSLGQPDVAASAFSRATASDPMSAAAYANLGRALDQMGQHRRAQTAYQRALGLDPQRAVTQSNYGLSLAMSGDLEAAAAELQAASAIPGAPSQVHQNYALVMGLKGDFDAMQAAAIVAPDEAIDANIALLIEFRGSIETPTTADETADVPDGLGLRGSTSETG